MPGGFNLDGPGKIKSEVCGRYGTPEELKKYLLFLADTLDTTSQPFAAAHIDGRMITSNRAFSELTGYTKEQLFRLTWNKELTPPEWLEHEKKMLALLDQTKKPIKYEKEYLRKDGSRVPVELNVHVLCDEKGDPLYYYGFINDLTGRKRAEEVLKKYKFIFDNARDIIFFSDINGRIMDINQAAVDTYGYSLDELLGMNVIDLRTPASKPLLKEQWEQCRNGGLFETMHQRKDGGAFPVEVNLKFLQLGKKQVVVSVIRDISGRKLVEEELHRANRALKALTKCTAAVIHAGDELELLNDVCQIIVETGGYKMAWIGYAEQDRAKTVRPIAQKGYEEGYLEKARITWADTERGRGPTGTAIRLGMPNFTRNVLTDPNFAPWRDEALKRGYASVLGLPMFSGDQVIGALSIYSERLDAFDTGELSLLMELADNLAYGITALRVRQKRDLAEKELREAKSRAELYVDLMGHDINNMNQVGIGFLELSLKKLEKDGSLGPDDKALLEKSLAALENSSRLIENVRKLQRVKACELKHNVIDIGNILAEIKAQYSYAFGRDITINLNFSPPDGYPVMANELLYDVFSNILGNAIKHSSGHLIVGIGLVKTMEQGKAYYKVTISDNGPGISDGEKKTIFKRLQSGRAKTRGTGLGLYLVKTLVESYKGEVWAEDRVEGDPAQGVRFMVVLPALTDYDDPIK